MKDLKLDPDTWDLAYEEGDLVIIEDQDVVEQSIKIALLTQLGEWAYDTDAGTAWIGQIMGRGVPDAAIEAEIRRVVLAVEGVTEVSDLTIVRDVLTRNVSITVYAATIYGDAEASLTV
jgi:hypothetical protein